MALVKNDKNGRPSTKLMVCLGGFDPAQFGAVVFSEDTPVKKPEPTLADPPKALNLLEQPQNPQCSDCDGFRVC